MNNKTTLIPASKRIYKNYQNKFGYYDDVANDQLKITNNYTGKYRYFDNNFFTRYSNEVNSLPIYIGNNFQSLSIINEYDEIKYIESIRSQEHNKPIKGFGPLAENDEVINNTGTETVPYDVSIDLLENNLDRIIVNNELEQKSEMCKRLHKLYDIFKVRDGDVLSGFSAGLWKSGVEIFDDKLIIHYSNGIYTLDKYPFIKAIGVEKDTELYLLLRGTKNKMKKTLISLSEGNKYNFVYQYPKYLLNEYSENYDSISDILIETSNIDGAKFYSLKNSKFGDSKSRESVNNVTLYGLNKLINKSK